MQHHGPSYIGPDLFGHGLDYDDGGQGGYEEQIAYALSQAESGAPVGEVCRQPAGQ